MVDDADNKDKAKNQKLTKERVDWIKGEFMGCLAKDDRCFIYNNNRVHKEGITAHLAGDIEEDMPKDLSYAHIKAYLIENPVTHEAIFPDWDERETMLKQLKKLGALPAWHEYYTLEDAVDKMVDYGFINSQRQLFHKHIIEGDIFKEDNMPWVQCLPLHLYDALVTYCDPAFGESKKGCYRAVVLVGLRNKHYDVINVWMNRYGSFARAQHEMALEIENGGPKFYDKTANVVIKAKAAHCLHFVESNQLQRRVLKYIYNEYNQTLETAWWPSFDMAVKGDKHGRIEGLEPLANQGYLRFNIAMKANRHMVTLRNQFKDFPNGLIDGPDAVEGAISKLRKKEKSTFEAPKEQNKYQVDQSRVG